MVSGFISGGVSTGVMYLGASATVGGIAGEIITAPVSIGLGFVSGSIIDY